MIISVIGCGGGATSDPTSSNSDAQKANSLEEDEKKLALLGRGLLGYEGTNKMYPAWRIANGYKVSKEISWRVLLLPYVEENNQYDKFDIMQPWDSAQNKPLADHKAREKFTLSNGHLMCMQLGKKYPYKLRSILDGTTNSIAMIENPKLTGDQWTQPVDLTVDEALANIKSLKKYEYLYAVLYSGEVKKIYSVEGKDISDDDIRGVLQHNDGRRINLEIFEP